LGNPKIAILAYNLAVGFILAVAFHSPSTELTAASEPSPDAGGGFEMTRRIVELGLKAKKS
jgi:hypothetical protein